MSDASNRPSARTLDIVREFFIRQRRVSQPISDEIRASLRQREYDAIPTAEACALYYYMLGATRDTLIPVSQYDAELDARETYRQQRSAEQDAEHQRWLRAEAERDATALACEQVGTCTPDKDDADFSDWGLPYRCTSCGLELRRHPEWEATSRARWRELREIAQKCKFERSYQHGEHFKCKNCGLHERHHAFERQTTTFNMPVVRTLA